MEEKLIIKTFKLEEKEVEVKVDLDNNTVWMIQNELAKLFGLDRTWIGKLIKKELENYDKTNSVCAYLAHTGTDNKEYKVKHYSLELILKIGYKIDVDKTLKFKEWVENTLKKLRSESVKSPLPIEVFEDGDFKLEVSISPRENTVWLTQKQIAQLFGCTVNNISMHIKNILENELKSDSVVKDFLNTADDGKNYIVKLYSLDVILSVGYKVNSARGIMFRVWVSKTLSQYLIKGYAIDETRVTLYKDNYLELNNAVLKLEDRMGNVENSINKFDDRINILEEKRKEEKVEKLFFNGEEYDAFSFLSNLVSKAKNKIILIDNYIDVGTLDILSKKKSNVDVEIITSHNRLTQRELNKFTSQYGNVTVKINANFHDRFLIIDNTYLYLIGASIKDAGKRAFCVSEISNQILNDLLLKI